MISWIPYAFATALALAAADFFIKIAAGKLSNSLALFLYGSCTFLSGLGWVLWERIRGIEQHAQIQGVFAALGVGIAFSLVTVGLYLTFAAGAPISRASPIIRLGGLLVASLIGLLFLKEPLTWRYAIGMVFACSGIYLIAAK